MRTDYKVGEAYGYFGVELPIDLKSDCRDMLEMKLRWLQAVAHLSTWRWKAALQTEDEMFCSGELQKDCLSPRSEWIVDLPCWLLLGPAAPLAFEEASLYEHMCNLQCPSSPCSVCMTRYR